MKNSALLLVLIALLSIAYYSEELLKKDERAAKDLNSRLYDPNMFGDFEGFEIPNTKLLKSKDRFYISSNYRPADSELVDNIFSIMASIKAKRFLTDEELTQFDSDKIFPDRKQKFSFYFNNGTLTYILGAKLDFDKAFYLEITNTITKKKTVVIAHDTTSEEGVYNKDNYHRNDEKYRRIQGILSLRDEQFYDKSLFSGIKHTELMSNWKSIKIENYRNRSFTVLLKEKTTSPSPYIGLTPKAKLMEEFVYNISKIKSFHLITDWNSKDLSTPVASFRIDKQNGKIDDIFLYSFFQGRKGYFLKTTLSKDLYELDDKTAKIFFVNLQYFWKRNVFNNSVNLFELNIGNESFSLNADLKHGFSIDLINNKKLMANQRNFKELFNLLRKDADVVDLFEELKSSMEGYKKVDFEILVNGDKYAFYDNEGSLEVINTTKNLKYSYYAEFETFKRSVSDYFYAKEK